MIPGDWRLAWYGAQCALLEGEFDKAAADFDGVLAKLPGELGPKLAIAATAELRDAPDDADALLRDGWRTDHSYVSAAFGLARQRVRAGDRVGAIAALDQVPRRVGAFHRRGRHRDRDPARRPNTRGPGRADAARCRVTHVSTGPGIARQAGMIRLQVLGAALGWLRAGNKNTRHTTARCPIRRARHPGRDGTRYRDLAQRRPTVWDRIALVEKANAIRPRTRV